MEQTRRWTAAGPAGADIAAELGHPQLVQFDRVRALLVSTRLPPLPDVYDLLWRYVNDRDHALSHAVDMAFLRQPFDLAVVAELRRRYCGAAAVPDPMPGVLDAAGIFASLDAARTTPGPLSIALIAIDSMADGDGTRPGDKLCEIAGYLAQSLGDAGDIGRVGDAALLLVLPGNSLGTAAGFADRLRAGLPRRLHVTISAGVAADRADETVEALIDRAEAALGTARRLGGNRVMPDVS